MKTTEEKYEYIRLWKARKRRECGIPLRGQKPFCPKGHARNKENLRPHKYDCRICHRERERERGRRAGAKPLVRRTREEKLFQRRKWEAKRNANKYGAYKEDVYPLTVYLKSKGICGICSEPVDVRGFEVDHVVPLSRGGLHAYSNVQAAHPSCNRKKWAKIA